MNKGIILLSSVCRIPVSVSKEIQSKCKANLLTPSRPRSHASYFPSVTSCNGLWVHEQLREDNQCCWEQWGTGLEHRQAPAHKTFSSRFASLQKRLENTSHHHHQTRLRHSFITLTLWKLIQACKITKVHVQRMHCGWSWTVKWLSVKSTAFSFSLCIQD